MQEKRIHNVCLVQIKSSVTHNNCNFSRQCIGSGVEGLILYEAYELPHDKTNKMTCAPSEDSDQPGHPPSLIRVFAVRMKKHWALNYLLSTH